MRLGQPILPVEPESSYDRQLNKLLYDFFRSLVNKVNLLGGLIGEATYNPANLVDGAGVTTTVAVPGATLGQFAQASFSLDTQGITVTAWVSAADVVSVRFQNETGGAIDLGSGTLKVKVATE